MSHVVIVGAGVIGLQTAVTLLVAGYTVTIIAKHWPGDESIEYTSPWAGAIWRTHATPDQVEQCKWDLESYQTWLSILASSPSQAQEMGLERCPIRIFSPSPSPPWYAPHVSDFSLTTSNLPPGARSSHAFTSIALNPTKYLSYLLARALDLGAHTITASLPARLPLALASALSFLPPNRPSSTVINCTGLSAHTLCPDKTVHPIRGQTLLARITPAPAREILLQDAAAGDEVTYIVPRPGTDLFVLGGTKTRGDWRGDWRAEAVEEVSEGILGRCRALLGEGVEIEVERVMVGLRPGREGGVRVEVERVDVGGGWVGVVHQYGHAGAGFQGSWGSSGKVLELVRGL